ncbi:MAG: hypothetical protein DHS20C18_18380 [Saprospiraceae bacterium]|nr:MAG: hypothetical protein DHS20C18_18380 [Saprospiraceae bacterium]
MLGLWGNMAAQQLEIGMETVTGRARTSFKGDLAEMVGFSELEITDADIDSAFQKFDLSAPGWVKNLFPGIRIEVDQEVNKKLARNISGVRFFARYRFIGGSVTISDPRLTEQQESKKFKNQFKAIRLSLGGKAEELVEHLALMALADETRVKPFFSKRYDIEGYIHLKKLFIGNEPLLVWGSKKNASIDAELTSGIRFTADPSPAVDLGSILFISEAIDELLEGGLLSPIESTTDRIAVAVQNVVFGKFRDPRVVPSMGWFIRGEAPVNFGGGFSVVAGAEFSVNNHVAIKGTKPMTSIYGFLGLRWRVLGK